MDNLRPPTLILTLSFIFTLRPWWQAGVRTLLSPTTEHSLGITTVGETCRVSKPAVVTHRAAPCTALRWRLGAMSGRGGRHLRAIPTTSNCGSRPAEHG